MPDNLAWIEAHAVVFQHSAHLVVGQFEPEGSSGGRCVPRDVIQPFLHYPKESDLNLGR
jgi:hypothetical protein